jgi:hypothetical protein
VPTNGGAAGSVLALLAELTDQTTAEHILKDHPQLKNATVTATFVMLIGEIGHVEACTLAGQHDFVRKVPLPNAKDSLKTLKSYFGLPATVEILKINPHVLEKSGEGILDLIETISEILGEKEAKAYLESCPSLLTSVSTDKVRCSWEQIGNSMGTVAGNRLVLKNPGILLSPPTTINGTWEYLKLELGEDIALK